MCLQCGAILTNDFMKRVHVEQCRKSQHPSSFGRDVEHFKNGEKRQPLRLSDFVRSVNTAKGKKLKPSHLVSELIDHVPALQAYDEKLVKHAVIAGCGNEVVGRDAVIAGCGNEVVVVSSPHQSPRCGV